MNKKRIIQSILLILVVVAGFVVWRHRPVSSVVRLDLTGTAGLKVTGTVLVDGAPREFKGILPTRITAEARSFEYTIWMEESPGELRGVLTVSDGVYGSSSTANDFSGVKGGYANTWRGRGGFFTTARKGE